jgi:hypothetical protein
MSIATFDTLKFAKSLKAAGFDEAKAEAISEAFKEAQQASLQDLATKSDLKELERATKSDLKELELKINAQLMLLKWMMGFILAGVVSLILKAFFIP